MTNRELWFRLVIRAFPAEHRERHEDEMVESVLAVSPTGFWPAVRQSAALVKAGVGISLRQSGTGEPLAAAAAWGAAVWLGLILGAGAFLRPIVGAARTASVPTYAADYGAALLGAALLLGAVVVARSIPWAALVMAGAGIAATALANTAPWWGWSPSIWYELRWLGPAVVGYVLLARWAAGPVWAATLASAVGMIAFINIDGVPVGETYGMLRLSPTVTSGIALVVITAVLVVWIVPGSGALAIVPVAHVTGLLLIRRSGDAAAWLLGLAYFAVAAYVTLKRRAPLPEPEPD
jgi:hypothetical protein